MRKYQWGNRNPQCGHLTIEEVEYRRAVKMMVVAVVFVSAIIGLEIVIWNI